MKKFVSAALLAMASTVAMAHPAVAGTLRAGAARISITPPAAEFPYVVPREKSIVGVHDDVFARALVLEDGTRRVVLLSLEQTTVHDPEETVKAVAAAANVPVANVMVTVTHTHNVFLTFYHGQITNPSQPKEIQRVHDAAVAAVKEAVAQLKPAKIGWARGQAYANVNNGEEVGSPGKWDTKAPSDKSLDVLRIEDASGKPLALMLNYASHAEVMFRSATKDGGYEVTGDLPGAVSHILEQNPAGAPVVLFTAGAEGDQKPLFKSLHAADPLAEADEGAGGWALLDVQARHVAATALNTIAAMPAGVSEVNIQAATGAAICPGQKYEIDRTTRKVTGIKDTGPVSIPLNMIRINDIALAGVGADIASDIGVKIKAASPTRKTTVVTMTAGALGYILNDAAYANPGHGAQGSPVKPGCAPAALSSGIAKLVGQKGK